MKRCIVAIGLAAGIALLAGPASAQFSPAGGAGPTSLGAEAQQNIGTAQLLYKLGQTQGQLALLQQQSAARATWWQQYARGAAARRPAAPPRPSPRTESVLPVSPYAAQHPSGPMSHPVPPFVVPGPTQAPVPAR